MAHFFRAPDRRQRFLLPLDMMEWLPEDDLVHLIVDAVGLMDLSKLEATCKVGGAGQPPFAPAMLLTVLIYAYSHGVRSSRVIERFFLCCYGDHRDLHSFPTRRSAESSRYRASVRLSPAST